MGSRAHKRLQEGGPRFDATAQEVQDLIARFFAAVSAEDFESARRLFAPNAVAISDGGRKARAARRILVGPDDIVHVLAAVWRRAAQEDNWTLEPCVSNGKPGMVRRVNGGVDFIMTLAPAPSGDVGWLYVMRNPDKLP